MVFLIAVHGMVSSFLVKRYMDDPSRTRSGRVSGPQMLSKFKFWRYSLVRVQFHEPRVCLFIHHLGYNPVSFRIKPGQKDDPREGCVTGFLRKREGLEAVGDMQRTVRIEVGFFICASFARGLFSRDILTWKGNKSPVAIPWS